MFSKLFKRYKITFSASRYTPFYLTLLGWRNIEKNGSLGVHQEHAYGYKNCSEDTLGLAIERIRSHQFKKR